MSLLIKALHQAEQKKTAEDKTGAAGDELGFALEPRDTDRAARAPADGGVSASQKAAGAVLAVGAERSNAPAYRLIAAGVLLLLGVAGAFYYYLQTLQTPDVIVPVRVAAPQPEVSPQPAPDDPTPAAVEETMPEVAELPAAPEDAQAVLAVPESTAAQTQTAQTPVVSAQAEPVATPAEPPVATKQPPAAQPARSADKKKAVEVTRRTPPPAVDPRLRAAYDAFNAGDDAAAQAAYRQVLQGDVRNIDALLGMAAIAVRQGRHNDAMGWYDQVLAIDPRNDFALAAQASLLATLDPVSAESRLRNQIALQPEAAQLHAALGDLYAAQARWASAQQAYFEAYRLADGNPEYAFNLAVSLDQLGKPALALQYYRQTLGLLGGAGASAIDRAALESRIAQLQ